VLPVELPCSTLGKLLQNKPHAIHMHTRCKGVIYGMHAKLSLCACVIVVEKVPAYRRHEHSGNEDELEHTLV